MIRRAAALALVGGLAAAFAAPAGAQEAQPLEFVSVDKDDYPDVTVTVAAPEELADTDLSKSFVVRENGRKRKVTTEPVASSSIEVVLVIDTSGSIAGAPLDAAKAAAIGFLQQLPRGTRVAVVGFGDAPYVASPMTTDTAAGQAAVQGLVAQGETALYDAVNTALGQFSVDAERSIVLLSDGKDTASATPLEAVTASLTTAGAAFHGINLQTADSDPAAMTALAQAAGGQAINAGDPTALAGVYDQIASSHANLWQIAFRAEGTGTTDLRVSLDAGGTRLEVDRAIDLPTTPAPGGEEEVVAARPELVTTPSNDWALPVGLVAVFVALLVAGLILLKPRAGKKAWAERARILQKGWHVGQLTEITKRAAQLAERGLEQRGRQRALGDSLEHAGLAFRPGEFIVLGVTCSFIAAMVGILVGGLPFAAVFGGITLAGFWFSISVLAERRRSKFGSQLGDTLQLLSSSLRAGYGLLQALDAVARESDSPTAEEFGRVVIETRLGRSASESLHALAKRMGNEDFDWVVQAIDIHREVGGDLTEVLDTVADTIRERERIRRQIKALSAEGRLSAAILFLLPFAMFLAIRVLNPEYMAELTGQSLGRVMLAVALALLLGGGLWLRKIVKLEF